MTDQEVEHRPGFPFMAMLFLLVALGLVASGQAQLAVAGAMPFCLAAALFLTREKPFRAKFTETALEVDLPRRQSFLYTQMQGLIALGRPPNPFTTGPRHYPIQIFHPGGTLSIPARLNVPSDEVYLFLYRHFPVKGGTNVNPVLADYLKQKEREFGADRVWSYRAREHRGLFRNTRRPQALCLAVAVAGLIWAVWAEQKAAAHDQSLLFILGMVGIPFALLFWLLFWLIQRQRVRVSNWKKASLIVSPDGLALIQGDLRGQLRWDEIRDVKLVKQVGARIKVAGALIDIADIYDRPLLLIYQQICYYWRGEPTDEEAERVWKRVEAASREVHRGDPRVTEG